MTIWEDFVPAFLSGLGLGLGIGAVLSREAARKLYDQDRHVLICGLLENPVPHSELCKDELRRRFRCEPAHEDLN